MRTAAPGARRPESRTRSGLPVRVGRVSRAEHVAAFLSAVDLSLELAARPEVRAAWGARAPAPG